MNNKQEMPSASLFDEISDAWEEIAEESSTEKQIKFILENIEAEGLVLDLCCGSGRHSIRLSEAGYNIIGLDVSGRLLRIAKLKVVKANTNFQLIKADMRFIPLRSEVFKAVLSIDSSFGYLSSEGEDLLSLREIFRTLEGKGVFLIDLFNRSRLEQRHEKRFSFWLEKYFLASLGRNPLVHKFFKWREYPSFFLLQIKHVNQNGKLIETWFIRSKKTKQINYYIHIIRLYNFRLLQKLIEKAGLKLVKTYGSYDGKEYDENSTRLIGIAQKPFQRQIETTNNPQFVKE